MRSAEEWFVKITALNALTIRTGGSPLSLKKNAVAVIGEAMEAAATDAFKRAGEKAAKLALEGRPPEEVKTEIETMK